MKALLILFSFLGVCSCSSKQWKPNVNFDNPLNWQGGKLPCANNRIVFPDTVNTVLMQTNISSVREIVLPNNGQILMLNNMVLSFSDTPSDADCSSEDANFMRTDPESWFDPDNWQDLDSLVTVETERVPCQYDSVIFPEDKLFSVNIDATATIGQMNFAGEDYVTRNFTAFLNNPVGSLQFSLSNDASVAIKGMACPSTSGCMCGNDDPDTLKRICDQYSCLSISCKDAVTPEGGCCALCGAILTMEFATSFNMADFNKRIHDDYHVHDTPTIVNNRRKRRELDTGEVDTYTSKTRSGYIQLVLTDKESGLSNGQKAITLAEQIMVDIQSDPASFGVTEVKMQSSKKGTGAQSGSITGGGVAGIIIAVIIIAIVVSTLGFIYMRRRPYFSKDLPLNADVDMSPGIPAGFMEEIPGQPPAIHMQSFDNPVYNTPTMEENLYSDPTKILTDVAMGDSGDLKKSGKKGKKGKGLPPSVENLDQRDDMNGFDNPTYSVLKDSGLSVGVPMPTHTDQHDGMEGFSNVGFDMSKQESDS